MKDWTLSNETLKALNEMLSNRDRRNKMLIHKWIYHSVYGKGQILTYCNYTFLFTVNFINALPNIREVLFSECMIMPHYNDLWAECLDLK